MEYKNKSASLTPGFTFPRKGENVVDDVRSADQRVSACVGSYDLDDRYSMVKKLEKKNEDPDKEKSKSESSVYADKVSRQKKSK